MLVLSRKVGEEILIANQVRVRVAGIQGKRVRLAISAPDEVSVLRAEVVRHLQFDLEPELLAQIGEQS